MTLDLYIWKVKGISRACLSAVMASFREHTPRQNGGTMYTGAPIGTHYTKFSTTTIQHAPAAIVNIVSWAV